MYTSTVIFLTFFNVAVSHAKSTLLHEDFCHINDFNNSETTYQPMQFYPHMDNVTDKAFSHHVELGRPFAVGGVTVDWMASQKWTDGYFRSIFSDFELFSSTFATNSSPVFEAHSRRDVYYGIFLNDRNLADFIASDYSYPRFIPKDLVLQGRCFYTRRSSHSLITYILDVFCADVLVSII